jgi:hypothetical protein
VETGYLRSPRLMTSFALQQQAGGGTTAPNGGASGSYAPGAGQQQAGNDRWADFAPVARSIMEVVSNDGAASDEGLHVAEIARRVGSSGDEMM